jgi:glycosyltransferase involved in cell wall biosynthesis
VRIGLISTAVPLVRGGGRFIVDWLHEKLVEYGHSVETVYIPFSDEYNHILPQMTVYRLIKLDDCFERVITFRPPAHMVQHPRKVVWFIHHLRMFYDLWKTPYCPVPKNASGRAMRAAIMAADTMALKEAWRLFTNSRVVADRIRRFNGLESQVLYPPLLAPEIFTGDDYGCEIVCVCRMEHHKRQHLLIDAMAFTRTAVRLRLCGRSMDPEYPRHLAERARRVGVSERIVIDARWVTESEKAELLGHALASAYVPFDEDSYGYPTLEAAYAQRCIVTLSDSGGVTEFVTNRETGLVAEPVPAALAEAFDALYSDRRLARRLGQAAQARVAELNIHWDSVITKLLA